jgi:hypothetical protein
MRFRFFVEPVLFVFVVSQLSSSWVTVRDRLRTAPESAS